MTTLINIETGITVDGVALNTLAKSPETKSGRLRVPGARGSNVVVNGRHGGIWGVKSFEEGKFVLPMWVLGCDDDGAVPTTALRQFYKNKDDLSRLFAKRYALLDVRATQPDGSVRQAMSEVLAAIDFSMLNAADARFNVEFTIPGTFWQDIATTDWNGAFTQAAGTAQIPYMTGSTAPIEDAQFILKMTNGTLTNPRITDYIGGSWAQYNGVLTAGGAASDWYFNSDTWISRAKSAAQADWDPTAGSSILSTTQKSTASTRFVSLNPDSVNGAVTVQVTGTWSAGATASLYVRGRRKFLS